MKVANCKCPYGKTFYTHPYRIKKMFKVGILGYGEVGKAIASFYEEPLIKDLERDEIGNRELDILHVCIPYTKNFVKEVSNLKSQIVIINSTVPVGTTRKIKNAVHSPIRGVHPYLKEGISTFVKLVGADDINLGVKTVNHFESLGIKSELFMDSRTTELGKLLDTSYYGTCIEFHRYANELCKKYGLDFNEVMTRFNETYNDGYTKLGKTNVVRPVLYAPEDEIGGHCIRQNAKMLKIKFKGGQLWK